MRKVFYKGRFVFIPLVAAAGLSIISFAVMQLWNNILPGVLRVSTITFWQAMCIFVLCKILFGFGGGRGGGAPWMRNRRMQERFKNMSSEEREQFRKQMGSRFRDYCGSGRWGRFNQPDAQNAEQETSTANNSTFNP